MISNSSIYIKITSNFYYIYLINISLEYSIQIPCIDELSKIRNHIYGNTFLYLYILVTINLLDNTSRY